MTFIREYGDMCVAADLAHDLVFGVGRSLRRFTTGADEVLWRAPHDIMGVDIALGVTLVTVESRQGIGQTYVIGEGAAAEEWPAGVKGLCIGMQGLLAYDDFHAKCLYIARANGDVVAKAPGVFYCLGFDGRHVVSSNEAGEFLCLDRFLQPLWKAAVKMHPGRKPIEGTDGVVMLEELAIVNLAVEPGSTTARVVALSLDNGSVVWTHEYPEHATVSFSDGKLMFARWGWMRVVDPQSGLTTLEQQLELEPGLGGDTLWSHSGHLLFMSMGNNLIRVLDHGGGHVRDLRICDRFRLTSSFHVLGDAFASVVMPRQIALTSVQRGIMYVDDVAGDADERVDLEPRPPYRVTEYVDDGGKKAYRTVLAGTLEQLLRMGRVIIQETAARFGNHVWTDEYRNKGWAGNMRFAVDLASLRESERKQIQDMVTEMVNHLRAMQIYSGDRKYSIGIQIVQATREELDSLPASGIAADSINIYDLASLAAPKPKKKPRKA